MPTWYLRTCEPTRGTDEIGRCQVRVRVEKASPEEKERLWPGLVAMYGGYENYRRRTDREIPVVVLRPVEQEA